MFRTYESATWYTEANESPLPMELVKRGAGGSVRVQILLYSGGQLLAVIRREGQSWAVLEESIVYE